MDDDPKRASRSVEGPWWVTMIVALITAGGTYLATRAATQQKLIEAETKRDEFDTKRRELEEKKVELEQQLSIEKIRVDAKQKELDVRQQEGRAKVEEERTDEYMKLLMKHDDDLRKISHGTEDGFFHLGFTNGCVDHDVIVALSYQAADNIWQTAGWYTISPGGPNFVGFTRNRIFFWYAKERGGSLEWAGNVPHTVTANAFEYIENPEFHAGYFKLPSDVQKNFRMSQISSDKQPGDYVLPLTCPAS